MAKARAASPAKETASELAAALERIQELEQELTTGQRAGA